MAEVFLKGAAYSIPFLVKSGKTTITNENVSSVRLGLGNLTASWPGGRLRYSDGYWLFPVTQTQSYALPQGDTYYQAQIQMPSGETFSSQKQRIYIDGTIFRTPFGETNLSMPESADAQPITAEIEPKPEQITVEIQPTSAPMAQTTQPYTTLRRYDYTGMFNGSSIPYRKKLFVDFHNLVPGKKYKLWLFTCSRRGGRKYGPWMHHLNYDADGLNEYGVGRLGYGTVAKSPLNSDRYPNAHEFAEVPEWMPNNGYLQTEWDIEDGTTSLEISLDEWIVPMMRPACVYSKESSWNGRFDSNADYEDFYGKMIGVAGRSAAAKLFRFCVADASGTVYPAMSTLAVGVIGSGAYAKDKTAAMMATTYPFTRIVGNTLYTRII